MDEEFFKLVDDPSDLVDYSSDKLDGSTLICECFCVSVHDIREASKQGVDIDFLRQKFGLGNGCKSCLKQKDYWIKKIF